LQETSTLVIDFNRAEHLESEQGSDHERHDRTVSWNSPNREFSPDPKCLKGTPMFIARAAQQGHPIAFPLRGAILGPIPKAPEPYASRHPDRVNEFPPMDYSLVLKASTNSAGPVWGRELDHDVESTFWLMFYWGLCVQPTQSSSRLNSELIGLGTWGCFTGSVHDRIRLLQSLPDSGAGVTHTDFQPLLSLIGRLAEILMVDRHWLKEGEPRNKSTYVVEAFQRLILQFILDNRDNAFMKLEVDTKLREVEKLEGLSGASHQHFNPKSSKKRQAINPSDEERDAKRAHLDRLVDATSQVWSLVASVSRSNLVLDDQNDGVDGDSD
jgi:hypothetical protein